MASYMYNVLLFALLVISLLAVPDVRAGDLLVVAPDVVSLQEQLSAEADRVGCDFIHGYDWRAWVDKWRNRGCSDEMFVSAFSRVAERTMDAEYWTADENKCMQALSSIGEFNVAASNLATVVRVVKNGKSHRVRRSATSVYYNTTKGSDIFLDFSEDVLLSTNLQSEVEAVVISGLWHDARAKQKERGKWGDRVSKLMRNYVERDVRGLDGADQILKWTDPGYASSPLRRSIRKRILAPGFKEVIERHKGGIGAGERVQKKYRREVEIEAGEEKAE